MRFLSTCLTVGVVRLSGPHGVQSGAEGRPHHQHSPGQAVRQPAGTEPHPGHRAVLQSTGTEFFSGGFCLCENDLIVGLIPVKHYSMQTLDTLPWISPNNESINNNQ